MFLINRHSYFLFHLYWNVCPCSTVNRPLRLTPILHTMTRLCICRKWNGCVVSVRRLLHVVDTFLFFSMKIRPGLTCKSVVVMWRLVHDDIFSKSAVWYSSVAPVKTSIIMLTCSGDFRSFSSRAVGLDRLTTVFGKVEEVTAVATLKEFVGNVKHTKVLLIDRVSMWSIEHVNNWTNVSSFGDSA